MALTASWTMRSPAPTSGNAALVAPYPPAFQLVEETAYPWFWMAGVPLNLDDLLRAIEQACAAAPGPARRKREPPTTAGLS